MNYNLEKEAVEVGYFLSRMGKDAPPSVLKATTFRGKEFSLKSTSFLKGYGYIEMRKKDFGMLDKLKREMSLTKIPQFNTTVDTDVIFYLLKEYFSLNWNP